MSSSSLGQSRPDNKKRNSKRKRSVSAAPSSRHLPPEAINPLSHPPNLLKQFRVAGLPETEHIPSVPDFPHRPLPQYSDLKRSAYDSDDDYDEGEDISELDGRTDSETGLDPETGTESEAERERREATKDRERAASRLRGEARYRRARDRNIGVLVGILRRCVAESDMVRAKRAFGLLVRADIDGRRVGLRREGFWGLGAEILMRNGEMAAEEDGAHLKKRRWGSVTNMVLVRRYFEDLVQLHPYNRLHPDSLSALEFQPVLFTYEVYNVQVELEMALEKAEEDDEEDGSGDMGDGDRGERLKETRDGLRIGALKAMRAVASRMDELMLNIPYSESVEMLRLRGKVALYMGNLALPAPPRSDEEEHEGSEQQKMENDRALAMFKRIVAQNEDLEPWERQFLADYDENEEDEEQEDEERGQNEKDGAQQFYSSIPIR